MSAPDFTAAYLPGLQAPALCEAGRTHTMTIEAMEALILEMQLAVLHARIAAKARATKRRLHTPETEVAELMRMVDMQLAAPETFPTAPPASEAHHEH